jgi:predicted dienelactone hydrolase
VPSLTVLGKIDSVVDNDEIRQAFTDATAPKYLVEIDNAGHYAFSNGCFPSPDCSPPVTLTQVEANAVVKRWVLPFLKLHLAGDTSFAAFFAAPVPPGVSFTAAP